MANNILSYLLERVRSEKAAAAEAAAKAASVQAEKKTYSFLEELDRIWRYRRLAPTVKGTVSKGVEVTWTLPGADLPGGDVQSVTGGVLQDVRNEIFAKTAGLAIRRNTTLGTVGIVFNLPGRDTYATEGTFWQQIRDVEYLRDKDDVACIAKLLSGLPPGHAVVREIVGVLRDLKKKESDTLLTRIDTTLEALESRKAALEVRFENIVPPMEALAAIPVGRTYKRRKT